MYEFTNQFLNKICTILLKAYRKTSFSLSIQNLSIHHVKIVWFYQKPTKIHPFPWRSKNCLYIASQLMHFWSIKAASRLLRYTILSFLLLDGNMTKGQLNYWITLVMWHSDTYTFQNIFSYTYNVLHRWITNCLCYYWLFHFSFIL